MNKRIISLLLTFALVLNMVVGIPVFAETGSKEYVYDGYAVEYKVYSEWTGNQTVEVLLKNTGTEDITGWALKYNAKGTVTGLWNGVSAANDETQYIIKNSSYNGKVKPGQSVNFGYTLQGESLSFPESFELCSKWAEKNGGYEVSYNVIGDWGYSYQAEISIRNTSDKVMDYWRLSFDSSVNIGNVWNAYTLKSDEGKYTLESAENTMNIGIGETKTFGLSGAKLPEEKVEFSDFVLLETVIDYNMVTEEENPKEKLEIMGTAEYNEDTGITIYWYSTQPDGIFEIFASDDNASFAFVGSVIDTDSYVYGNALFERKFFKVRQTAESGETAESEVFVVERTENGYETSYTDTDEDGLTDIIEKELGTDPINPDTDNDGLTDYEEVYITGTDPLVYDSAVSGTADGNADIDSDELSNRTEIDIGTEPLCADTDSDGLNDGDEVNKYGTNPLKYDTDGDKIGDGDEITLGLDPKSAVTNGIPDDERKFIQTINEDNEILSEINTEENPYKVSLEFEAAGLAKTSLSAGKSGYSGVMRSDAILGEIPEFDYTDGLSVGEVTVKFGIKEGYVDNKLGTYAESCDELKDIKRLNIFRYFEESNILLPVETFYDESKNEIYTKTDRLGTYCVMDMEVWLKNLGVEPIQTEPETEEVFDEQSNEYSVNIQQLFATKDEPKASHEHVDVVFALDTRSSISDADFTAMKQLIKDSSAMLFERGHDIRVYVDVQDCSASGIFTNSVLGGKYFTDSESLNSAIDGAGRRKVNSLFGEYVLSETLSGLLNRLDKERYTYLFTVADKNNVKAESNSIENVYEACAKAANGFNASVVSVSADVNEYSFAGETAKATDGIVLSENDVNKLDKHVSTGKNDGQILLATSFMPLPEDYEEVSKRNNGDYDKDKLLNIEEYDEETICSITGITVNDSNMNSALPTIMECSNYISTTENIDIIKKAFEKYCNGNLGEKISEKLNTNKVLLVTSDPSEPDSDGDGITDGLKLMGNAKYTDDEKPLKYSYKYYDDELYPIHLKHKDWIFNFQCYNITLDEVVDFEYNFCNRYSAPSTVSKKSEYAINDEDLEKRIQEIINYNKKFNFGISDENTLRTRISDSGNTLITRDGVNNLLNPKSYLTEQGIYAFLTINAHDDIINKDLLSSILTNTYFDTDIGNTSKEEFVNFFFDIGVDIDPYYVFIKTCMENATKTYYDDTQKYSRYINGTMGKYVYGGINANNGSASEDSFKLSPDTWTTPLKGLYGMCEFTQSKYVDNGQNTSYLMRFDINNATILNDPNQYSTSTEIVMEQSKLYYKYIINDSNYVDGKLTFDIPVYIE